MNKDNRITLWIIGSNGSGKTTQAKLLHQIEPNSSPIYKTSSLAGSTICYTEFGPSHLVCNVGWVKDNQCTGVDSLSTREQIEKSYQKALFSQNKIIIVDGIMATGTWLNFLRNDKTKLIVILLHFESTIQNAKRIQQRRANKENGVVRPIEEKTFKNLEGKIKGFKSMFDKAKQVADESLQINANLPEQEIHEAICKLIFETI